MGKFLSLGECSQHLGFSYREVAKHAPSCRTDDCEFSSTVRVPVELTPISETPFIQLALLSSHKLYRKVVHTKTNIDRSVAFYKEYVAYIAAAFDTLKLRSQTIGFH